MLEGNDRLVDQIKYIGDLTQEVRVTDEWHSDGTYLWQWSKLRGLVRMNRNKDFSPIESTMLRNEDATEWNIVSFCVLNQKIFIRTDAHEDQPFVLYDIESLKAIEGDPFTCEQDPELLKWTSKDLEADGEECRHMRATPICTDG